MPDSIEETLDRLAKLYATNPPVNETETITKVILIILASMGYEDHDFQQEYAVSNFKVDIAVLPNDKDENTWFIEAKAWNETLSDNNVQQSLNYVNTAGLRFAVLTNGREWRLYDNSRQGEASNKLALKTCITDPEAVEFFDRISKTNIGNLPERLNFTYLKDEIQTQLFNSASGLRRTMANKIAKDFNMRASDPSIQKAIAEILNCQNSRTVGANEVHSRLVSNETVTNKSTAEAKPEPAAQPGLICKTLDKMNPKETRGGKLKLVKISDKEAPLNSWHEMIKTLLMNENVAANFSELISKMGNPPHPMVCDESQKSKVRVPSDAVTLPTGAVAYYEKKISSHTAVSNLMKICKISGFDQSQITICYRPKT